MFSAAIFVWHFSIEIPPQTETIVEGFPDDVIGKDDTGLLEVNTNFLLTKGLLVAKALVCPATETVPIQIANPYQQSCTL